jgi:hypothetical protein
MRHQQDAIMKIFRETEKKVEEAGEDAETVYKTEMEMIRNFYMRSESPSPLPPGGDNPGATGVLLAGGNGGQMAPTANPLLRHTAPEDQPPQPKQDG